jgi:hypothetical protein
VNTLGIRGLRDNVSEWAQEALPRGKSREYYIMGGPEANYKFPTCPLARNPWEAFADVGFRTVLHQ